MTSSIELMLLQTYANLNILHMKSLSTLLIKLRDQETSHTQFAYYANRLMRILAEEGLASCSNDVQTVTTPTGNQISGGVPVRGEDICVVSIIRAGDSLLSAVLECDPSVTVGKILIQRDEASETKSPILYYSKLPPNVASFRHVLLVDPMLATGGSALMAIQKLCEAGVKEDCITFLNVISCPEGIHALFHQFPAVKVVTAALDGGLNSQKYIVPGLGDYGDRFFNTI